MNRRLSILPVIFILITLLSGCFLYDNTVGNNISPFIDPLNGGGEGFIPEANAEKIIPLDVEDEVIVIEEEEEEDDGIIILGENSIRQTKPPIIEVNENSQLNYYYDGDSFLFQIPFLWRTTMEVDIVYEEEDDFEVTYYSFYYVPSDQIYSPPERAQVMTLRVAPYSFYLRHGHGTNGYAANGMVNAADGIAYTYYAPDESQKLSSDFINLDDFNTIIKVLTSNWNFQHKRQD